jgi:hypothetical protein
MSLDTLHPWIKKLLEKFIDEGFYGWIINCHSWLDPKETSPTHDELEQLSRPFEELETARHEGLTLTFRGSKAFRMSDLEVILKDPWVVKVSGFYVIIGNVTAEHPYDGMMYEHTIVLYSIMYGDVLGNALVLSRLGHFTPNAKADS